MDQTQLFKASLMAVKLQRRGDKAAASHSGGAHNEQPDKRRILPTTTTTSKKAPAGGGDEFMREARDVCHKITGLRNVLLENRTAYMRIGQHLKSAAHMTDAQRDLIDRESEKVVAFYTQHLARLRADWKVAKRKPQQRQHMDGVLELLERYLRSVQAIYLEQKKYRVQHELETYRLLKLAADKQKIPVRPAGEHSGRPPAPHRKRQRSEASGSDGGDCGSGSGSAVISPHNSSADEEEEDGEGGEDQPQLRQRRRPQSAGGVRQRSASQDSHDDDDDDERAEWNAAAARLAARRRNSPSAGAGGGGGDSKSATATVTAKTPNALDNEEEDSEERQHSNAGLTPDEIQMYEQENVSLYHELQGVAEEVEQIEKNVVDIAHLQDIFTEKVSLQQHNIERIASAVVGATENVKDANEQIMQAIQRNAGLRVWSLFFLLVMSFALLFLDWYYD